MKERIIEILKQAGGETVSGPEISARLDISRVAVWKHLKQMKEMGYAISSNPRGYYLDPSSDTPLPLYFKGHRDNIHYFPMLNSTMDKARELARADASHMSAVVAEVQQSGRGRLNRKWVSQEGGLWFSMILRPLLPPPLAWQVNFAASVAMSITLKKIFDLDVRVKWPNDILYQERKLAGLLSEMETEGDMISFVIIGIGLNVNNSPSKAEPNAISIMDILGKPVHRRNLLSDFLDQFEATVDEHVKKQKHSSDSASFTPSIITQWKEMTGTIGKKVRIETYDDFFEGVAVDVDDTGALLIEKDDGTICKVIYGDCFHQGVGANI
ncbi:Biotin/acetyl-CoA-carboxylase ligase [Desulfamplus magnetovallimortis]|uniref:Bifunctional ligase/repressor BirA n=1 Tax=Desulfamplus magnetovallimortis TaxID=1246637 RepID=A0A1W1H778_9BACT|nr:biotin--[acetyl-CoA-carboxylase] ligase [Desulfamplus magnetovallimortis]SLM28238.1 Biotin/acetyl-CoA-carboxylase ligase [Desulfamplus magnetovallimortis]